MNLNESGKKIREEILNTENRLYDPVVGRMLNTDPFVSDFTSSQNYNRYSYVNNNPLRYTDPSGYYPNKNMFRGNYYQSAAKWQNYLNMKYGRNVIGIDIDAFSMDFYWFVGGGGGGGDGTYELVLGLSVAGDGYEVIAGNYIDGHVYLQAANGTMISNDPSANMQQPTYSISNQEWGYWINRGMTREAYSWVDFNLGSRGVSFLSCSEYTYVRNELFVSRNNLPETGYLGDFMGNSYFTSSELNGGGITLPGFGIILNNIKKNNRMMICHEAGHPVQAALHGLGYFYGVIAPLSLTSATFFGSNHQNMPWEMWANTYSWMALGMPTWWNKNDYPYFE